MDEKTRIFNEEFDEFSGEGSRENEYQEDDNLEDEKTGSKTSMPGFISLGVGVAAGLGAGVLGTHYAYGNFLQKDDLPEEPSPIPETSFLAEILVKANTPIATGISEEMSLEEAYAFAREEVGPGGVFVWNGSVYGTYNEEEWNELTTEQQNDYYSNFNLMPEENQQVSLFDNITVSTTVNDDMTFGEAFAAARSELGSVGVFMWHGNAYNTFYKEEWAEMTSSERENFLAGFLEIPDENLIANADTALTTDPDETLADVESTGSGFSPDNQAQDDYPVADPWNHDEHSSDFEGDIYIAMPYTEDPYPGEILEDENVVGGDFGFDINLPENYEFGMEDYNVGDEASLDRFIHDMLYSGQNTGQQYDEDTDLFPDDFVSGIGSTDDFNI